METERGKGEYEARVSGRVNNNARRQMSIPPPLFAWSARRSLIPVPLALLRTSLCRRQRPMSSSNTRLGGPRSTWCGPTPIKHRCFVESPSTGISSFFSFFLSRSLSLSTPALLFSLSLYPSDFFCFFCTISRSFSYLLPCFCLCMCVRFLVSCSFFFHQRVHYAPGGAVPSRERYRNWDEWQLSCDMSGIRFVWIGVTVAKIL